MTPFETAFPPGDDTAETVVLVDLEDREVGTAPKLRAHRDALLHRAFSVIVLDDAGRMLLQRRADGKYHSPGLWSNSCCGHPRPGEDLAAAAGRRLAEEMGFGCDLAPLGRLHYAVAFDNGLSENELVTIFVGRHGGSVPFNTDEVSAVRWVDPRDLLVELDHAPAAFTYWFRLYLTRHRDLLAPTLDTARAA